MPSERFIANERMPEQLDLTAQVERLRKLLAKRKKAELIEEACVNCYDEAEQCSALAEMAGQELAFAIAATVMGEAVEVDDDTEDSGGGHG